MLKRSFPIVLFVLLILTACTESPIDGFPIEIVVSSQEKPEKSVLKFIQLRYQKLDKAVMAYDEYLQSLVGGKDISDELFEQGHLILLEQRRSTESIVAEFIQSNSSIKEVSVAAVMANVKAAESKYQNSLSLVQDRVSDVALNDRFTGAYSLKNMLEELKDDEFDVLAAEIKANMLAQNRPDLWWAYSKMRFSKISDYRVSGQKPSLEVMVTGALNSYVDRKNPNWQQAVQWRLYQQVLEQGFLAYPLLSVFSSLQDSGVNGYLGSSRLDALDSQIRDALKGAGSD